MIFFILNVRNPLLHPVNKRRLLIVSLQIISVISVEFVIRAHGLKPIVIEAHYLWLKGALAHFQVVLNHLLFLPLLIKAIFNSSPPLLILLVRVLVTRKPLRRELVRLRCLQNGWRYALRLPRGVIGLKNLIAIWHLS